jgi:hypothetical protein
VASVFRRIRRAGLRIKVTGGSSAPSALAISGAPGAAAVGAAYSFGPGVIGGSGAKSYALTGTLPDGLVFSTSTGAITGTPTTVGTITGLSIAVTDASGSATLSGLSIVVTAAPVALALSGTPPVGAIGSTYSFIPTVSGGSGTKAFSLSGVLPDGLSFSTSTGAITGTPTTAGTTSGLAITVSDTSGSATLSGLSIVVSAVAQPPAGFVYLADPDGSRLTDPDGAYLMEAA